MFFDTKITKLNTISPYTFMYLTGRNFSFHFRHGALELMNDFLADFYEDHGKYYFSYWMAGLRCFLYFMCTQWWISFSQCHQEDFTLDDDFLFWYFLKFDRFSIIVKNFIAFNLRCWSFWNLFFQCWDWGDQRNKNCKGMMVKLKRYCVYCSFFFNISVEDFDWFTLKLK